MRADVYTALDELKRELAATNQNIGDLGDKLDRRGTEHAVVYYPEGDTAAGAGDGTRDQLLTVDCGRIYDQAFNDLRNGNYDLAIEGFEEFLNSCASSPDIPRALYWLGECHYSNDDFATAIEVFERLVDQYPESDQVPGALFKLGRCYEKSDQPRNAIDYYNRLIESYPDAPYVQPARGRLEDLTGDGGG
jgi:tol-pal system protein YbgF